jgi:hypothetical protein
MSGYGTRTISTSGRGVRASADGNPHAKVGGALIDWSTVTAVSGDTTLSDGTVVKDGDKYLRYGQVICQITASGKFGPYDAATPATDGRQTLTNGDCYIIDETVVMSDPKSDYPIAIDGGRVFADRISDITGNPSLATLVGKMPLLVLVDD